MELNTMDNTRKIVKDGDYLYIPVNSDFTLVSLTETIGTNFELMEKALPQNKSAARSYRELLEKKLPPEKIEILPRSFDITGSIAVIKIPDLLVNDSKDIGESILSTNPHIESVYKNMGVQGPFRILELEHLAGENNPVTVHKEFGIEIKLDVSKVYFSPRLATERNRLAGLVKEGEFIVDMFTGVGPFSIMIAKLSRPRSITAIDINPDAVKFLNENIKINGIKTIIPKHGDAGVVIKELPEYGEIDRIIMNLPHSGFEFLPAAVDAIKNNGLIHFYEILSMDKIHDRMDDLTEPKMEENVKIEVTYHRRIHSYSPSEILVGFDLKVNKNR